MGVVLAVVGAVLGVFLLALIGAVPLAFAGMLVFGILHAGVLPSVPAFGFWVSYLFGFVFVSLAGSLGHAQVAAKA